MRQKSTFWKKLGSLLLALFGLYLVFGAFYHAIFVPLWDLNSLTAKDMKEGRIVSGTITSVFTVSKYNSDARIGKSGTKTVGQKIYDSYTVPIGDGCYIKVWISGEEAKQSMERIVRGEKAEVSFIGKIKRSMLPITDVWYFANPDFDESLLIRQYEIMEYRPVPLWHRLMGGLFVCWLGFSMFMQAVRMDLKAMPFYEGYYKKEEKHESEGSDQSASQREEI